MIFGTAVFLASFGGLRVLHLALGAAGRRP